MFVQSKSTTVHSEKNGICIKERRGGAEVLVKWSNGRCKWVNRDDLQGAIHIIDANGNNFDDTEVAQ